MVYRFSPVKLIFFVFFLSSVEHSRAKSKIYPKNIILTHNKIVNKARDDINYFNFNVKMHKKKNLNVANRRQR